MRLHWHEGRLNAPEVGGVERGAPGDLKARICPTCTDAVQSALLALWPVRASRPRPVAADPVPARSPSTARRGIELPRGAFAA